nr:putative reverse transcriptase domain-containing protein [Tanacetum cinerariifolium]
MTQSGSLSVALPNLHISSLPEQQIVWKLSQDYTSKKLSPDMAFQYLSSRIVTVISHPDSGNHYKVLWKCLSDESLVILMKELRLDDKLNFVEEPLEVMDQEVKQLKQSRIPIVKVRWNSKRGPEFTWYHEDQIRAKLMSSPNHHTSNIENAFSSNFPDYILASSDYVPASPGKTYSSSSNNSFGLVLIALPTFSLFHHDPCMKVMHAYYAKESPIPPPVIMPPSLMLSPMFNPQEFFLPEELLPPKKHRRD